MRYHLPFIGSYASNMFLLLLSLVVLQAAEAQQATPATGQEIIGMINDFRRAIAKGEDPNAAPSSLPTTGQMFKLEPDNDLIKRAVALTLVCDDVQSPLAPPAPYSYVYYRPIIGEALYPVDNTIKGCPTGAGSTTCPPVDNKASACDDGLCVPDKGMTFPLCCEVLQLCTYKHEMHCSCDEYHLKAECYGYNVMEEKNIDVASFKRGTYHSTNHSFNNCKHHSVYGSSNLCVFVYVFKYHYIYNHHHNNNNSYNYNNCCSSDHKGNAGYDCLNAQQSQRYDTLLGAEAQNFAQSCPTNTAATVNNYEYGQNVLIAPTVSVPYGDLVQSAIRNWFDEIYANGMNNKMNFTEFLATKPNPPTHFTQMVWANHMTVGCGAHRCGSNTVVVCRYKPGGNIIGQFVYQVGAPCSACNFGCNTQFSLCTVPLRN
ncbi:unnamed protein product [Nippostrongylus brasiliensis]|uniref:SCP domain-containing protein n=1 Tax=Nippostrongylus brasiliensis TaxID=27835 RepID=A0A0N4Y9U4_NIPBR|nr:unnamed protein product [Nippostrongylus brasiliensis]